MSIPAGGEGELGELRELRELGEKIEQSGDEVSRGAGEQGSRGEERPKRGK
jgi:hypothetical protein